MRQINRQGTVVKWESLFKEEKSQEVIDEEGGYLGRVIVKNKELDIKKDRAPEMTIHTVKDGKQKVYVVRAMNEVKRVDHLAWARRYRDEP